MKKMLGMWLLAAVVIAVGALIYQRMNGANAPAVSTTPPQATSVKPQDVPKKEGMIYIREIDSSLEDQTVLTGGTVTKASEGKGNIYFTLTDSKTQKSINCVLFAKTNENNPEYKEIVQRSKNDGSTLYVRGKVAIYEGALEIIAWKVSTK